MSAQGIVDGAASSSGKLKALLAQAGALVNASSGSDQARLKQQVAAWAGALRKGAAVDLCLF